MKNDFIADWIYGVLTNFIVFIRKIIRHNLPLYRKRQLSFGTITYFLGIQIVKYNTPVKHEKASCH